MKSTKEIVKSIIDSFYYNRNDEDVIMLCEEVKDRICAYNANCTDDGDIFYGMLVLLYGEYGTSPRTGWMESDDKEIIEIINEEIEILKRKKNEKTEDA